MDLDLELQYRLRNWSHWMQGFARNEVGYPSQSTLVNFGNGSLPVRKSKPPFPINNVLADEMNGWVNIMGAKHPEWKEALRRYYLTKFRIWELAQQCNVSTRTFKQRLHDAKNWLEGRLSIEINYKKPISSAAPR